MRQDTLHDLFQVIAVQVHHDFTTAAYALASQHTCARLTTNYEFSITPIYALHYICSVLVEIQLMNMCCSVLFYVDVVLQRLGTVMRFWRMVPCGATAVTFGFETAA